MCCVRVRKMCAHERMLEDFQVASDLNVLTQQQQNQHSRAIISIRSCHSLRISFIRKLSDTHVWMWIQEI